MQSVYLETEALWATLPSNMLNNLACDPCSTAEAWPLLSHGRTGSYMLSMSQNEVGMT